MNTMKSINYLVFEALDTRPATHDEGVIGGNNGNDIDLFGLEFIVLFDVWGQVVHMAGGLLTRITITRHI